MTAPTFYDRVKVAVSGTPGTGNATLGAALSGFQTFAAAGVPNSGPVSYVIEDGTNWEIGHGVYTTSGPTLTRTTVIASSNSGSHISATSSAVVYLTALAEDFAAISSGHALGSHTHWRLYVTSVGQTASSIAELELRATMGGSAQHANSYARSTTYGTGYDAAQADDSNTSTFWSSTGGGTQWIEFIYTTPITVAEIHIIGRTDSNFSQNVNDCELYYSDDGSAYLPVARFYDPAITGGSAETSTFEVPSNLP